MSRRASSEAERADAQGASFLTGGGETPAEACAPAAATLAGAPVEAALPAPHAGSRHRIVFADDNADMREYVARLLGERWDVETAGDGAAALAAIRRRPPALVLCDVMMPELDGFGLVQALRADAALRTIPIILLSARAGEDEIARGLASGANDYIAKPFSAHELLVRVASQLATAHANEEARSREIVQRDNLYRLFMQAPFPVCVFRGPDHVIELANPLILHAWGKGSEIVGAPLVAAIPELRGQPFVGYLDGVFRTGVTYEGQAEPARLPTGPSGELEERYYNFVYAALRDAGGTIEGTLVSAFDMTDLILAQRASEQARQEAETALRGALDFQERFVAILGHDLRNPLAAIDMATGLLRQQAERAKDAATIRVLTRMRSSSRRMSRMIEQILDLSRSRLGGGLRVEPAPMDLGAMLAAVVEELRTAHPDRQIELRCAPTLGTWDRDRLEQVFSNLISNAVHHGLASAPVIIDARQGADTVCVEVHNHGTPISAALRGTLFSASRRGDRDSRAVKTAGLGLGLFISRELVLAHGGEIDVRSSADDGTTFYVILPLTTMRLPHNEVKPP